MILHGKPSSSIKRDVLISLPNQGRFSRLNCIVYLELLSSFPATEKLTSILIKFNSNVSVLSLVFLEKELLK